MRLRRLFNKNSDAGITTYIIIMFGMAFMLYLFGFTSAYDQWKGGSDINGSTGTNINITNPNLNMGNIVIQLLMNPLVILGSTMGVLLGIGLVGRFTGAGTTIWQYAIPGVILVALNIFVFPIGNMTSDFNSLNSIDFPITLFLILFFNLFYILAVVDFIRGPTG